MTVRSFVQPAMDVDDASSYKGNIEAALAVCAEISRQFAPREMAVLGMGITIEAGSLKDGTSIAAQNVAGIGAPAVSPRIDRIYLRLTDHTVQRSVGVETALPAVPAAPALPANAYPLAQILLTPGMAQITNADIVDERSFIAYIPVQIAAGYMELLDPDGTVAFTSGRLGFDNRRIIRTHTDEAGSSLNIQNVGFTDLAIFNGAGDLTLLRRFACNGKLPAAPPSVGAAAVDLASALTLVNNLRTALINVGLVTA